LGEDAHLIKKSIQVVSQHGIKGPDTMALIGVLLMYFFCTITPLICTTTPLIGVRYVYIFKTFGFRFRFSLHL